MGGRARWGCSSSRCSTASTSPSSRPAEFVHVVTECAKLAFADRDALYGDADVPLERLLSRRVQRGAPRADRRGSVRRLHARDGAGCRRVVGAAVTPGAGEPTRGDTVHLDVVDRWGNMLSATPSGGWLHSSPVIPALGWPLGTRAQMFWLEEGLPSSLAAWRAAADDALSRPRASRRQAVPRVGHAGRRPAGAVGAPRLPAPRRPRTEPAGGDRRARLPHRPPDLVVLSARLRPPLGHGRVAVRRRGRRRPAPPRARGRGGGAVVARPRHRGRARGGRPAESRREPARHAGLRGRAVEPGRSRPVGSAILGAWSHRVT